MNYLERAYDISVTDKNDTLTLHKIYSSEWCEIIMTTNGKPNGIMQIRSKEMVEQLWFMLGQMLDK